MKVEITSLEGDLLGLYSNGEILIDKDTPRQLEPLVFYHEFLHKIFEDCQCKLTEYVGEFPSVNSHSFEDLLELLNKVLKNTIHYSRILMPNFWEEVICTYIPAYVIGGYRRYKIKKNVEKDLTPWNIIENLVRVLKKIPYNFGIYLAENYSPKEIFGVNEPSEVVEKIIKSKDPLKYVKKKLEPLLREYSKSKYYKEVVEEIRYIRDFVKSIIRKMKACEKIAKIILKEVKKRWKFDKLWEKDFLKVLTYALFSISEDIRECKTNDPYMLDGFGLAKVLKEENSIESIINFFKELQERVEIFF